MKIKKITVENFGKHLNKEFDLAPITLIKGYNGAGKSTIHEAISFALDGAVRRLPRKLESISKLSNDGDLSVSITTDENVITRGISKNKTKLSESLEISSFDPSLSLKDKQAMLKEEYSITDLLINPMNFVNLSSNDKSKYILSLLDSENLNKDKIIGILSEKFGDNSVIDTCLETLNDSSLGYIDAIDNILKFLNSYKRILSKDIKDCNENIFKIADIKAGIKEIDVEKFKNISSYESEIAELKAKIGKATEDKAKRAKYFKEITQMEESKKSFKSAKELDKSMEEIKESIKKFEMISLNLEEEDKLSVLQEQLLDIKEAGTKNNLEIQYLEKEIKKLTNLGLSLKGIGTTKKCVIDESITCSNSFDNKLIELRAEIKGLKGQLEGYNKIRVDLLDKYKKHTAELSELKETIQFNRNAYKLAQTKLKVLKTDLSNIQNDVIQFKTLTEKIDLFKSEMDKIQICDISIIQGTLAAKTQELKALYDDYSSYTELNSNLKLAEQGDKSKEIKENELDCLKKVEKYFKKEKLEALEEGIKPFKTKMNEILGALGYEYKVFAQNDGKQATIGFEIDDKCINVDMLSTGETMVFIISLIGAIYDNTNNKFKLLVLDDLDNLDKKNLNTLIENKSVLNTYFDNVLLIGVLESYNFDEYQDDLFKTILME